MIPDGGWEAESNNTGGPIFASDLPVPFDCVYTEGGDGSIDKASTLPFNQVSIQSLGSVVLPVFGSGLDNARTMRVTLRQPRVFGVLLLDSFTPPIVGFEFFDVVPFTQDACTAPAYQGFSPDYAGCAVGSVPSFTNIAGSETTFTDV